MCCSGQFCHKFLKPHFQYHKVLFPICKTAYKLQNVLTWFSYQLFSSRILHKDMAISNQLLNCQRSSPPYVSAYSMCQYTTWVSFSVRHLTTALTRESRRTNRTIHPFTSASASSCSVQVILYPVNAWKTRKLICILKFPKRWIVEYP